MLIKSNNLKLVVCSLVFFIWDSMLFDKIKYNIRKFLKILIRRFIYLTRSVYIDPIKRWIQYFAQEQMLILKMAEDLFNNPEQTVNKIFKFLVLPELTLNEYETYKKLKKMKLKKKQSKNYINSLLHLINN